MTEFNYWHYIVLFVLLSIYGLSVYGVVKNSKPKLLVPMIFSITLIAIVMVGFSLVVVDKYTKIVKLYKVENKRMLQQEKIMYTGIVKNEGNHMIGEVVFEVKLVNKGMSAGNVKPGSFYSPSGFGDFFFGKGADILYKPQQITKRFVVAKGLKPGRTKSFRVYFDYPAYFKSVAHYLEVEAN